MKGTCNTIWLMNVIIKKDIASKFRSEEGKEISANYLSRDFAIVVFSKMYM